MRTRRELDLAVQALEQKVADMEAKIATLTVPSTPARTRKEKD